MKTIAHLIFILLEQGISANRVHTEELNLVSLAMPKPIELCEQGNFEKLFELYYDKPSAAGKVKIHGYQPSDYLTEPTFRNRECFISNISEARKFAATKLRDTSRYSSKNEMKFHGYQPIHYAAAQGNLEAVRKLVEKYKFSPKSHEVFNDSLYIACYHGHFEVLRYLVEDCECYKAEENEEQLLLSRLCSEVHDNKYRVKELQGDARRELYTNLRGNKGTGHIRIMQLVLKHRQGGKFKNTPVELLQLVLLRGKYKHIVFLEKFLEADAKTVIMHAMDLKPQKRIPMAYQFKRFYNDARIIEYAFFGNNVSLVMELLNNNVITSNAEFILHAMRNSATNKMLSVLVANSATPMYEKIEYRGVSFIECIASSAASSPEVCFMLDLLLATFGSCVDSKKQNVLHYICKNGSCHSLAKYVMSQTPNLQRRTDSNGQLPLHVACSVDCPKVELLNAVSANCNINSRDREGNTPMHIACLNSNWEVVQYLYVELKASILLKNNEDMIPLHFINLMYPAFLVKILNPAIAGEVDSNGNTLLHIACIHGNDIPYIIDLVRAGVPIHRPNKNGETALHFVPRWDWSQMSTEKIKGVVDILSNSQTGKAQDIVGNTPLHIACYCSVNASQLALVKYILHKMPSSAALYNKEGKLPIHIILGKFIAVHKYDGNKYYNADMALVESLLDQIDENLPDGNGNTPLHLACSVPVHQYNSIFFLMNSSQIRNCNLIPFLLKSKAAFTHIQNNNGELPLHLLLKHGCCDYHLIKLLISPHSLCVQDKDGNTPLHIACQRGLSFHIATTCIYSAISLLVDESSSSFVYYSSSHFKKLFLASTLRLDALNCLSLQNKDGHTPLQVLLYYMESPRVILEVVAMFCLDQAYKNDTSLCDNLCLHNCVQMQGICDLKISPSFVVTRALINSVNANIKNSNGDSLLHVAVEKGTVELLQYLLEQCTGITSIKNNQGNTPLHLACRYMRPTSVLKLLEIRSEDITALNKDGLAPIHLAVKHGNSLAVEYLLSTYKGVLSVKTSRGKLPIQLFFQICIENNQPLVCYIYGIECDQKMARILALKCDDCYHSLNATEKTLMTQLACSINFVETKRYQKEGAAFLAQNCSLKSPPYCHIDRTQLLHMAAWFGRTDILHYLISEEYIDPQDVDEKGRNALVYACRCPGHVTAYFEYTPVPSRDAIQLLIERGCSILYEWEEKSFTGLLLPGGNGELRTNYHLFRELCHRENVELVRAAVTTVIDNQDCYGNTPLMIVITARSLKSEFELESAKFLIQDCACDQHLVNYEGHEALHLACQYDCLLNVVKLLDITYAHRTHVSFRKTPVEIAIERGSLEYLLSNAPIEDVEKVKLIELLLNAKQPNYKAASLILRGLTFKLVLEQQLDMSNKTIKLLLDVFSIESESWNFVLDQTLIFAACKYNLHLLVEKFLNFESSYSSLRNGKGDTPLHVACRHNRRKTVKIILRKCGSDMSALISDSNTPLHVACCRNHYKVVKVLKRYGANVTAPNAEGDTPLHVACRHASYQCVKVLGSSECSNMQNKSGKTPLHLACEIGSYACVTALSKSSWSITNNSGDTPLHIACRFGSFSIVYSFTKFRHFSVDHACKAPSIVNDNGELPLHIALKTFGKQSTTLIRLHALLELTMFTPILQEFNELMFLVCECKTSLSYKIAHHLKARGIKIDTHDAHGRLPIHHAASKSLELVRVCASRSTVNAQDRDGNTALHVACMKGRYTICKYLAIEMKCDISIRNQRGESALHKACNALSIRPNICLLLLREDCFIPDKSGNYPLHYLCKKFSTKAYKVLVDMVKAMDALGLCGHIVSYPNDCRELPIHFLCKSREQSALNAVKLLLPHTRDLNIRDLSGNAPIHLACLSERHDVIQLLARNRRCDTTIEDLEKNLPLHLACKMRVVVNLDEMWEEYYSREFDFNGRVLYFKVAVDKSRIFIATIQHLATDVTVNAVNMNGDYPLHVLLRNYYDDYSIGGFVEGGVRELYCEILATIISNNGPLQLKQKTPLGEFPIHIACKFQQLGAIKEVGVEGISELTSVGDNIFHSACRNPLVKYEVFKYLVEVSGGDYHRLLKEENSNGNIPLHLYSMFSDLFTDESFQFLSTNSDINYKNHNGDTPLHLLLVRDNLGLKSAAFKKFIHNEECDFTSVNHNGEMILDLLTESRLNHSFVTEIAKFNSEPLRLQKLKHILSCAGEDFILKLYLLEKDIITILADLEIDPAPLYKAHREFFNNEKEPLQIPISMLFIGDSMTGKTTLVNSLRKEAGLDVSESEPERTAGIIPSSFQSSKYGRVTAYDFAGHREYYAGHEAVMQSILQKTPPIVLIHVNLAVSTEKIVRDVRYWSAFMSNRLKGSVSMKAPLFIVCSHADLDIGNKLQETSASIKSIISTNENFHLVRIIGMDCRESGSPEINVLVSLLADTTSSLRRKGVASFRAHCLYVFLTQHLKGKLFITMNELFHQQRKIEACMRQGQSQIFQDFKELRGLCEELASNGQILLMRDNVSQSSFILLRQEELLKEVSGKVLAHKGFPGYKEISSITGVIPFSKVKALFPKYNPKLIFQYLCSIEYCFEVTDKVILKYILAQEDISPSEHYYFFPEHVTEEYPDRLELWDPCKCLKFCWVLRCKDNEFFSPKFIQLLLLRLLFGPINVEKIATKIWKSGLFWYNSDGIKTLVNVIDTEIVIVLMQCKPDDLFALLSDRSIYLNLARDLQQEICPSLHCKEFFVHHSSVEKYLESTESKYLVSMNEVCKKIESNKKYTVTRHGNFAIQELILFDPYVFLCANLLDVMLNQEYSTREIPVKLMKLLKQHFSRCKFPNILSRILGLPTASESSGDLKNSSWRLTFTDLKHKFDKTSTFATYAG